MDEKKKKKNQRAKEAHQIYIEKPVKEDEKQVQNRRLQAPSPKLLAWDHLLKCKKPRTPFSLSWWKGKENKVSQFHTHKQEELNLATRASFSFILSTTLLLFVIWELF